MLEIYLPREDSFLLESKILKEKLRSKKCLDLGTGSGILGRAMLRAGAKEVWFADINFDAIKVAKRNLKKSKEHKFLDKSKSVRVHFIESNLFSALEKEKFDLIAFNPPYVPSDEIKWLDTDGGEEGMQVIEKFLLDFEKHLEKKGVLLLLFSSLNNKKRIFYLLKKQKFSFKIIAEQSFFFEKIFVLRATK